MKPLPTTGPFYRQALVVTPDGGRATVWLREGTTPPAPARVERVYAGIRTVRCSAGRLTGWT